jgi:Zn-dependent protease with chaperone function
MIAALCVLVFFGVTLLLGCAFVVRQRLRAPLSPQAVLAWLRRVAAASLPEGEAFGPAAAVLADWRLEPLPAGSLSHCSPADRAIYLTLTDAAGDYFDRETLLVVLAHEVAHAVLGPAHGPALFGLEKRLCSAMQGHGQLSPMYDVDPLYPHVLLRDAPREVST